MEGESVGLTNKQVYTIWKGKGTIRARALEVLAAYGKTEDDVNINSLWERVKALDKKVKLFQRSPKKKAEYAEYIEQTFRLPQKSLNPTRQKHCPLQVAEMDTAASVNADLAAELFAVKTKLENCESELADANLTILKMKQFQPSRLNQTIKRHKESIRKQKAKVARLRGELKAAKKAQGEPAEPPKPAKRCKKEGGGSVPPGDRVLRCEACVHMDWSVKFRIDELKALRERIRTLENEKTILEDKINDEKRGTSNIIRSKGDGKKYSLQLRQVMHHLVSANVEVSKLQTVIRTVLQRLANKDMDSFPDIKTCRNIIREMEMASAFQMASDLSKKQNKTQQASGLSMAQNKVQAGTSFSKTQKKTQVTPALGMAQNQTQAITSHGTAQNQPEMTLFEMAQNQRQTAANFGIAGTEPSTSTTSIYQQD